MKSGMMKRKWKRMGWLIDFDRGVGQKRGLGGLSLDHRGGGIVLPYLERFEIS
jgi:hypothetical protein